MRFRFVWILVALLSLGACQNTEKDSQNRVLNPGGNQPVVNSSVIFVNELPAEFDLSRTYVYEFSQVDPEPLLIALWSAGIPVSQAWQALDDQCLNPVGPRFTVELTRGDESILQHGFASGVGQLQCATRLTRYTIMD